MQGEGALTEAMADSARRQAKSDAKLEDAIARHTAMTEDHARTVDNIHSKVTRLETQFRRRIT